MPDKFQLSSQPLNRQQSRGLLLIAKILIVLKLSNYKVLLLTIAHSPLIKFPETIPLTLVTMSLVMMDKKQINPTHPVSAAICKKQLWAYVGV